MRKIKLNERQILMLQNLEQDKSNKNKVLKITESQYNRLFKDKGKATKKLSKSIKKAGMTETTKKINLVDFAEEIVVFIKDILSKSNHRTMPYSSYWVDLGISKNQLFNLVKKHGLLTLLDEKSEIREYMAPKQGFRKKIKELYKVISEWGDAGYPAGASNDSNAPWNQPDLEGDGEVEIITIPDESKKFRILYKGEDDIAIFKAGNELFVASLSDIGDINDDPETFDGKVYLYDYNKQPDDITAQGFEDYVNDMYSQGEMKPVRNDNTNKFPVPTLVTSRIKAKLLELYGNDEQLIQILGQIPESTTAASSGAYVGGGPFNGPIKKGMSHSPAEEMSSLINDNRFGQEAVVAYAGKLTGEEPFEAAGEKWVYCWGDYNGKRDIAVYRPNTDMAYDYSWFRKTVLGIDEEIAETTSTGTVGAGVGANGQGTQTTPQYAYDAPAGDGKDFWTAGNKQNKKMGKNGTPIVRGGSMNENIKVGQVYKNGLARRKVLDIKKHPLTQSKKIIVVKQWGDGDAREINIDPKEWGNWELLMEKRIIRVTQEQFNKIVESENMTKTAYPNGEMVSFDDCTKFNNNTKAQDGGCSTGAVDGVVKTNKTKGSVVAENFNPQIAAGSNYAIEVKPKGAYVHLKQNNGQVVVVHYDDIPQLINILNSIQ